MELPSNLLTSIAVGSICGAIAHVAYRMGKNDAAVEFMAGYILKVSDRDLTGLELLDELHGEGITAAGFGNLYPALNRLEKLGLISSYMQNGRKFYTKQPQPVRAESKSN